MAARRPDGAVHPGWRWGPFTARFPLVHTRVEWLEVFQGMVVAASTGLALVPLLQSAFGLSFEEAIAISMIHNMLIATGPILFGEPFAAGWITPSLPITLSFILGQYTDPTERFQAMTAVTLNFTALLLLLGVTGLGRRLIIWLPNALKAGVIMGASIAAFKRVFLDDIDKFMEQPIATGSAIVICLIFTFSAPFRRLKMQYKILGVLAGLGLLPGFLAAAIIGPLTGEIHYDIMPGFLWPPMGSLMEKVSPFYIGWPSVEMFLATLPLALITYTILFGDLITGMEMIREAAPQRPDEKVEFDINRSHFSLAVRNGVMALFAPFFPTQGTLWAGVHVVVVQRWRQGRDAVDSIFSGISSYYVFGLPLFFFVLPIVTALTPLMPIALSLTLVLTGFACAYIAMAIATTPEERGVAMMTGISLAFFAPWIGLLVGLVGTLVMVGLQSPDET